MSGANRFTPGPWTLVTDETGRRKIRGQGRVVDTLGMRTTDADASLLVSAPAQYAALKMAVRALDDCARYFIGTGPQPTPDALAETIGAADEALAKAEGR